MADAVAIAKATRENHAIQIQRYVCVGRERKGEEEGKGGRKWGDLRTNPGRCKHDSWRIWTENRWFAGPRSCDAERRRELERGCEAGRGNERGDKGRNVRALPLRFPERILPDSSPIPARFQPFPASFLDFLAHTGPVERAR